MMKSIFRRTINPLFAKSTQTHSMRYMSTSTLNKDQLESDVASYYGKNANYAGLFGTNIHFGYFPHIADSSKKAVTFPESGYALNKHMIEVAGINESSNVIDFGCGVGGPIFDVSQQTGCSATGVDLTKEFIDQANADFGSKSDKVDYVQGSITNLPSELKQGPKFSHLFSIQCICHIAQCFNDVCREAASVLDTNGIMVINDFVVSEDGPSDKAKAHFYDRLHFTKLLSFADFAEGLTNNGFDIIKYENCSQHAKYGYEILAPQAEQAQMISEDGIALSKHYQETSDCFKRGELGMVVIVARKK